MNGVSWKVLVSLLCQSSGSGRKNPALDHVINVLEEHSCLEVSQVATQINLHIVLFQKWQPELVWKILGQYFSRKWRNISDSKFIVQLLLLDSPYNIYQSLLQMSAFLVSSFHFYSFMTLRHPLSYIILILLNAKIMDPLQDAISFSFFQEFHQCFQFLQKLFSR